MFKGLPPCSRRRGSAARVRFTGRANSPSEPLRRCSGQAAKQGETAPSKTSPYLMVPTRGQVDCSRHRPYNHTGSSRQAPSPTRGAGGMLLRDGFGRRRRRPRRSDHQIAVTARRHRLNCTFVREGGGNATVAVIWWFDLQAKSSRHTQRRYYPSIRSSITSHRSINPPSELTSGSSKTAVIFSILVLKIRSVYVLVHPQRVSFCFLVGTICN